MMQHFLIIEERTKNSYIDKTVQVLFRKRMEKD